MADRYVIADSSARKGGGVSRYTRPLQSVAGIGQPKVHSNKQALQIQAIDNIVQGAISAYGAWDRSRAAKDSQSNRQRKILLEAYQRNLTRQGGASIATPDQSQAFDDAFVKSWREGEFAGLPYRAELDTEEFAAERKFMRDDLASTTNLNRVSSLTPVTAAAYDNWVKGGKDSTLNARSFQLTHTLGYVDKANSPTMNVSAGVFEGVVDKAAISSMALYAVSGDDIVAGKDGGVNFPEDLAKKFNRGEISSDIFSHGMQTYIKFSEAKAKAIAQEEKLENNAAEKYMIDKASEYASVVGVDTGGLPLTPPQVSKLYAQKNAGSKKLADDLVLALQSGVDRTEVLSQASSAAQAGFITSKDMQRLLKVSAVPSSIVNNSVEEFKNVAFPDFFAGQFDTYFPKIARGVGEGREDVAQALVRLKKAPEMDTARGIVSGANGGLVGAHYAVQEHFRTSPQELAQVISDGPSADFRERISESLDNLEDRIARESNPYRVQSLDQDLQILRGIQDFYGGPARLSKPPGGEVNRLPAGETSIIDTIFNPIYEWFSFDDADK